MLISKDVYDSQHTLFVPSPSAGAGPVRRGGVRAARRGPLLRGAGGQVPLLPGARRDAHGRRGQVQDGLDAGVGRQPHHHRPRRRRPLHAPHPGPYLHRPRHRHPSARGGPLRDDVGQHPGGKPRRQRYPAGRDRPVRAARRLPLRPGLLRRGRLPRRPDPRRQPALTAQAADSSDARSAADSIDARSAADSTLSPPPPRSRRTVPQRKHVLVPRRLVFE
mmetsp:Transcript_27588/g.72924  ORF Transcript_27588/g.72924 Transcript_27588/m.72924 type:complete len:220 (+) Transcript_27588:276-935(+)